MRSAQFDRYAPYFRWAGMLIALLTYWRFRYISLSAVYAYVAQDAVIRSALLQPILPSRSLVWDFSDCLTGWSPLILLH